LRGTLKTIAGRRPPGIARLAACFGGVLAAALPVAGSAETAAEVLPQAVGRVVSAGEGPTALFLLTSGSYGYTESVLGLGDAHHRLAGSLAVDGRPLPWLGLALRLDGRYDMHVVPGRAGDDGLVGDPRLYLRVDRALGGGLGIGARTGVWLPGGSAPSIDPGALSPELVGAFTYAPRSAALSVSANLGYRVDRSARTATDAMTLGPGDRLALDVSAFDQVLMGVLASARVGAAQAFAEGSWELLVGEGSPPPSRSPIRIGAGVRLPLGSRVVLEAQAEVSPSARPGAGVTDALVPVPPRVTARLGLAYRFSAPPPPPSPAPPAWSPPPREASPPPPVPAAVPPVAPTAPTAPEVPEAPLPSDTSDAVAAPPVAPEAAAAPRRPSGQLRGFVRSLRGGGPVSADIRIDPTGQVLRADGGRFEIDVPPGAYEVEISARGYTTQTRRVQVEDNGVTLLNVDLRRPR
jgi:hypothetical protein